MIILEVAAACASFGVLVCFRMVLLHAYLLKIERLALADLAVGQNIERSLAIIDYVDQQTENCREHMFHFHLWTFNQIHGKSLPK